MAIIKVASSIFSTVRTITKALKVAKTGDTIHLSEGTYNEHIEIEGTVTIEGAGTQHTCIEGSVIVKKGASIVFENITFHPSTTIQIDGNVFFNHCDISTSHVRTLLCVSGTLDIKHSIVSGAKEIGIELRPNAQLTIDQCAIYSNGKANILADYATVDLYNSTLHSANHAIWLRNSSSLNSTKNKFSHHSGTQLIAHQQSVIVDKGSYITHGKGNGIYASNQADVTLSGTRLEEHVLPQIWIQNAHMQARNIRICNGRESGVMLRDHATADICDAEFMHHKLAHVQVTLHSHAHIMTSQLTYSEGNALQVKEQSTANVVESKVAYSQLAQCHISEKSVFNSNDSFFTNGEQVGIYAERASVAQLMRSTVSNHASSALSAVESSLRLDDCDVFENVGNAVLLLNSSDVVAEDCRFYQNDMPHFAGKTNAFITVRRSTLAKGKSLYALDESNVLLEQCHIHDSEGIQLEVQQRTKMYIHQCTIAAGQSNGIKASGQSYVELTDSQVSDHRFPQLVFDDSQLIVRNCELHSGQENGIILENDAEGFIEDTFISNHGLPQLWVDHNSNVELRSVHFTDAVASDIFARNHSTIDIYKCFVNNTKMEHNIQALNHSTIDLHDSIIRNTIGDVFYIENHSSITKDVEEH
ncbi:right-handed parallel beta-helix repeat-containing protein [Caryophanon latum]|uniref:Right handed beta helix domain-containing protein n=1 Tax=Caryophanon latum TaxID=33977 RepID=A0A1C0YTJ2_9BACL|nr:right-handed parallel beta-helix repeat-containing protein [Caryophanon latum]OCS90473.1 hypothetical protein A6K76_11445 [Caryophanon latum]